MKDEQKEALRYFKDKYNEITLILEMNHENDSLLINLKNLQTFECFEKVIDFQYFQEHQQVGFIFQNPAQIMKYISDHFDKIAINKYGEIQFSIQIIAGIKEKTITFKTDKKIIDKFDQLNLKIQFLKDMFEEKMDLKEQKIKALEESNTTLIKQIQTLSKERQIARKLRMNSANPFNSHNEYFKTYIVGNSLIVNHTNQANGFYNFILSHQICIGTKVTYKVRLLTTTQNNIYFGFGTKGVFGVSSQCNPEIMLFYCNGQIYEGGPYRNIDLKVDKGDILECSADLITNQAFWKKNGQEEIQISIPEKMKGNSLYFVAYSHWKTDSFEVIFEQ